MRHLWITSCLAGALALGACALPSSIGSGPLRLSPQVQAVYEKYRRLPSPGAFAVTLDGRTAGSSVCPVGIDCRGNPISGALNSCRRSGRPCFIYDEGGHVVWRYDLPAPPAAPTIPAATESDLRA